ncbi:MAG TPA: hypothetical protein PKN48_06150 [Bacteroidales bacterium]|nr:hypothetical protein [Bacteroidales bacterium]
MKKIETLTLLIFSLVFFFGCTTKFPDIKWNQSDEDIIGTKFTKDESIKLDVYIDATTSMEGFAVGNNTNYSQFLDQLEASARSVWKSADLKFYKFGEKIKPIDRSTYLSSKNDQIFYRESGIFKKTFIDNVIKNTDTKRLSIVLTDLFQDEGDVNIMVEKLKEQCFKKNVMVGFLCVKSNFNGRVFDTPENPNGYKHVSSDRPFYALMFGNPANMEILLESLKTKPFVREDHVFLISNYLMKSLDISLLKSRDSKSVSKKAPREKANNSFDFSMKEDGKEAKFDLTINFERNPRVADFSEKNIDIVVYKKSISDPKVKSSDSVLTEDIRIENIKRSGNKLTATVILNNNDPIGNYSYLIYLRANQINGLLAPSWIKNISTDNPIPNTPSANKTYNLEKFISTLLVAKNSVNPTNVAKFYLNLYKR